MSTPEELFCPEKAFISRPARGPRQEQDNPRNSLRSSDMHDFFWRISRSFATMIRPVGLLRSHLCVFDFDPQPGLSSFRDGRY